MTQREIVDRELEEKEEEIKQEMKHLIEKIVSMIQLEIHDTAHWLPKASGVDNDLLVAYVKADENKQNTEELVKEKIKSILTEV